MNNKYFFLSLFGSVIFFFVNGQVSCPKWGPYIGTVYADKDIEAEAMLADVMVPKEGNAPYTYTCVIQFGIGKSGGYCGLQNKNGDTKGNAPIPYNNIFSIWDFPNKEQIVETYKNPITFVGGFGNEGTGLHSHADFGWIPGHWYTILVRRWYVSGERTNVGFFIFDQTQKKWAHYVTFAVPEKDAMLKKTPSSFLENFSDGKKTPRFSYYRSYWILDNRDQWLKPEKLEAGAGDGFWDAKPFGADGILLQSCGPKFIKKEKVAFPNTSKQDKPESSIVSKVQIYDGGAYYDKLQKQIHVNWITKEDGAPQLSYSIALLDAPNSGKILASTHGMDPDLRNVVLNTDALQLEDHAYYIKIKLQDVFNQYSEEKIIELSDLKP